MIVGLDNLEAAVRKALTDGGDSIRRYIKQLPEGGATGLEGEFVRHLHSQFDENNLKIEQPLKDICSAPNFLERTKGRVDAIYINGSLKSAAEYKVARLPRTVGGTEYYIGQISSDYMRLSYSDLINQGYIVLFLHGPMLERINSEKQLWNETYNEFNKDTSYLLKNLKMKPKDYEAAYYLGWLEEWDDDDIPIWGRAILNNDIGAIIIECKDN